jgi:hypothetical protein
MNPYQPTVCEYPKVPSLLRCWVLGALSGFFYVLPVFLTMVVCSIVEFAPIADVAKLFLALGCSLPLAAVTLCIAAQLIVSAANVFDDRSRVLSGRHLMFYED